MNKRLVPGTAASYPPYTSVFRKKLPIGFRSSNASIHLSSLVWDCPIARHEHRTLRLHPVW